VAGRVSFFFDLRCCNSSKTWSATTSWPRPSMDPKLRLISSFCWPAALQVAKKQGTIGKNGNLILPGLVLVVHGNSTSPPRAQVADFIHFRICSQNGNWHGRSALLPWWPLLQTWACSYVSLYSSMSNGDWNLIQQVILMGSGRLRVAHGGSGAKTPPLAVRPQCAHSNGRGQRLVCWPRGNIQWIKQLVKIFGPELIH